MTEIAGPRRHRRFRVAGWSTVGVAAAAAAAIVVTNLPGTPTTPAAVPPVQTPKVMTAAAVLDYAAEAARSEPAVAPRPDQYVYTKTVVQDGYVEEWTAVDHKRNGYAIYAEPDHQGDTGPTPPCREYELTIPTPHGDVTTKHCDAESGYLSGDPATVEETVKFVLQQVGMGAERTDFIKSAFDLVSEYMMAPQLKTAIFEALKSVQLPGQSITVDPHVRDLAGREGIGLVWHTNGRQKAYVTELVFDAKTYQFLGTPRDALVALKVVDHVKQR